MELQKNDLAPDFEILDIYDQLITPTNSDEEYTLLSFFRYAGCPWCNLAIYELTRAEKILRKQNVRVVVVTPSSNKNIMQFIIDRHIPEPKFSIIGNPSLSLYRKYHIKNSLLAGIKSITHIDKWIKAATRLGFPQAEIDGNLTLVPAQFLINHRTGKIVKSHYGVNYADTTTFTDIYNKGLFQ